eukprot:2698798-Amphidinium_carterae.1
MAAHCSFDVAATFDSDCQRSCNTPLNVCCLGVELEQANANYSTEKLDSSLLGDQTENCTERAKCACVGRHAGECLERSGALSNKAFPVAQSGVQVMRRRSKVQAAGPLATLERSSEDTSPSTCPAPYVCSCSEAAALRSLRRRPSHGWQARLISMQRVTQVRQNPVKAAGTSATPPSDNLRFGCAGLI